MEYGRLNEAFNKKTDKTLTVEQGNAHYNDTNFSPTFTEVVQSFGRTIVKSSVFSF